MTPLEQLAEIAAGDTVKTPLDLERRLAVEARIDRLRLDFMDSQAQFHKIVGEQSGRIFEGRSFREAIDKLMLETCLAARGGKP